MKNNKKMQNFDLIKDEVIFRNYLRNISNKDLKRNVSLNKTFVGIYDVSQILKKCYLEIKENIRSRGIIKFLQSKLDVPRSTLECWIYGRNPIPIFRAHAFLKIWRDICKKTQEEFDKKWDEIFESTQTYSAFGSGRRAKLPKELTIDLAYIMGFILADGYIKSDDKLLNRNKQPEYTIAMYSESKIFLRNVGDLFYDIFGVKCNLHYAEDKKGSWYTLRCTSKPVHRFFCDVLGFKRGIKTGNMDVPKIIAESPEIFQKAFIAGFFDGDGGVGFTSKNPWLELGQTSINDKPILLMLWIQDKLKYFGINLSLSKATYQNLWRLRTGSKKEINKFYDVISSRHPNKISTYESIGGFSYGTKI